MHPRMELYVFASHFAKETTKPRRGFDNFQINLLLLGSCNGLLRVEVSSHGHFQNVVFGALLLNHPCKSELVKDPAPSLAIGPGGSKCLKDRSSSWGMPWCPGCCLKVLWY